MQNDDVSDRDGAYAVTPQNAWLSSSTTSANVVSVGVDNQGAAFDESDTADLQHHPPHSGLTAKERPSDNESLRDSISSSQRSLKNRAASLPSLTLQDLEKTVNTDQHTAPTSPLSEGGSSIWEHESDIVTVLIDPSTGKSIQQRRRKSLKSSIKSRDSSRESICESEGTSSSSKSKKKKRRNRLVDIDDIVLEFDPEKEFLWEMWKKYEREKLRKRSMDDLHSLSGDEGYHTRHKTGRSEIDLSGARVHTSEFSLHRSVGKLKKIHSRKGSNASNMSYTSGEETLVSEETTSVQGAHSVPTPPPPDTPSQVPGTTQPIEVTADIEHPANIENCVPDKDSTSVSQGKTAKVSAKNKRTFVSPDDRTDIEMLVLHRLPGEKLGMGLSVESSGGENDPVKGVFVQSVTPGGAADRATGGRYGLCVGDQILEVNGSPLRETSYSETVTFFKEMPLRVMFTVCRHRQPELETPLESLLNTEKEETADDELMSSIAEVPNTIQNPNVPAGFELVVVSVQKPDPKENLGLTIMPSYGSTSQFYQVRAFIYSSILQISHLPRMFPCKITGIAQVRQRTQTLHQIVCASAPRKVTIKSK